LVLWKFIEAATG
jgi:hypothetical protein